MRYSRLPAQTAAMTILSDTEARAVNLVEVTYGPNCVWSAPRCLSVPLAQPDGPHAVTPTLGLCAGRLVQFLKEEAEEQGQEVPEPPTESRTWCAVQGLPALPAAYGTCSLAAGRSLRKPHCACRARRNALIALHTWPPQERGGHPGVLCLGRQGGTRGRCASQARGAPHPARRRCHLCQVVPRPGAQQDGMRTAQVRYGVRCAAYT